MNMLISVEVHEYAHFCTDLYMQISKPTHFIFVGKKYHQFENTKLPHN